METTDFDNIIASDNLILIDFYATWCGPCQMLSPILEEISKRSAGVRLREDNILFMLSRRLKDLANEYVKKALDSLYKEYNYNKYSDIKHNPLKYFLKENKDVPPVPEGYI